MYDLLNDSDKFTLINDDWFKVIIKHEDQINRFLSSLLQNEAIDKAMYDHLRIPSFRPGILFGLPKIHKKRCSSSSHLIFNWNLWLWLGKILSPHLEHLTQNEYSVKDSFSFADEISKFDNANGLVMASFDIQSLFTNIPLDETINICADSIYANNGSFFSLSIDKFKKFLQLAVKDVLFIFND